MMKKFLVQLLLFSALTLFLPIAAAALCGGAPQTSAFTTFLSQQESTTGQSAQTQDNAQEVVLPILNSATGEVEQVPLREFLIGAAASEMPASYQDEAIKAQIIAALSYALANRDAQQANPDPDLKGAWFAANPDGHEGYIRPDGLKAVWGDQYQEYYDRLAALVDEVGGLVVTYEGNPALTTYYALCNGTTETSEAVWGQALPYLAPVDTPMVAHAKMIRARNKKAKVVFIGPCSAKKMEFKLEKTGGAIDCVMSFEEMIAYIDALEIDMARLEETPLDDASYYGRIFAKSGGIKEGVVAVAKQAGIEGINPVSMNGLEECKRELALLKANRSTYNFFEGMACEGGCIGGALNLHRDPKGMRLLDKFNASATKKDISASVEKYKASLEKEQEQQ